MPTIAEIYRKEVILPTGEGKIGYDYIHLLFQAISEVIDLNLPTGTVIGEWTTIEGGGFERQYNGLRLQLVREIPAVVRLNSVTADGFVLSGEKFDRDFGIDTETEGFRLLRMLNREITNYLIQHT